MQKRGKSAAYETGPAWNLAGAYHDGIRCRRDRISSRAELDGLGIVAARCGQRDLISVRTSDASRARDRPAKELTRATWERFRCRLPRNAIRCCCLGAPRCSRIIQESCFDEGFQSWVCCRDPRRVDRVRSSSAGEGFRFIAMTRCRFTIGDTSWCRGVGGDVVPDRGRWSGGDSTGCSFIYPRSPPWESIAASRRVVRSEWSDGSQSAAWSDLATTGCRNVLVRRRSLLHGAYELISFLRRVGRRGNVMFQRSRSSRRTGRALHLTSPSSLVNASCSCSERGARIVAPEVIGS